MSAVWPAQGPSRFLARLDPAAWLRALNPHDARDMAWATFAYLAIHLAMWTLLPALSHRAPPWDNIEQLVWSQSLEWGYYKHPPAPTWWMVLWTQLLGRSLWVTYFAAQLSVVAMLACVWRIALLVTSPVRAFTAVVLTSLVAYHGLRGIMANHNTLQLMPVGMLLWATLAAVRDRRAWWRWMLVGAAAALCLLSKYSALVWFAAIGLWLLTDARMHNARAWASAAIALAVCTLLLMPHAAWLFNAGFPSLAYAGHALRPASWLAVDASPAPMPVAQRWAGATEAPLQVIAGDTWLAGNAAIHLPSQPLIFIDADASKSPWISESVLARCGLMVLIDRSAGAPAPSAEVDRLMARAQARGPIDLPWTPKPGGPRLLADWGVVLPDEAAGHADCSPKAHRIARAAQASR